MPSASAVSVSPSYISALRHDPPALDPVDPRPDRELAEQRRRPAVVHGQPGGHARMPDAMFAMPSISSNAHAIQPPCTKPGGPSYAAPNVPRASTTTRAVVVDRLSQSRRGDSGLASPTIGERGQVVAVIARAVARALVASATEAERELLDVLGDRRAASSASTSSTDIVASISRARQSPLASSGPLGSREYARAESGMPGRGFGHRGHTCP